MGGILTEGGVYDFFFFFDGGDYVAELVEPPPPPEIFKILIANGAFWINLDHQLRADISPIFSEYFA